MTDDKLLRRAQAELWAAIEACPDSTIKAYDRASAAALKIFEDDPHQAAVVVAQLGLVRLSLARRNAEVRQLDRDFVADVEGTWPGNTVNFGEPHDEVFIDRTQPEPDTREDQQRPGT